MSALRQVERRISAEFEPGTEGLRGLCALIVLYTHLFAPYPHVDPVYAPSKLFWAIEAGQGAVLLFFVLSGYVIGLTNQRPFSGAVARDYGRRRAIRLLPMYALAVVFSFAVRHQDTWSTLFGNLLFLQNEIPIGSWHVPLLSSNTNLWSLNYEVLYYGLFLLVWLLPRAWPMWLTAAALTATFGWHMPVAGTAVATYAAGWVFWLSGFALARTPKAADPGTSRFPWPSLLLLWLATWHLKPLWWFAHRFSLLPANEAWMNYSFCDLIPACVALLIAAGNHRPRHGMAIAHVALAIPLAFSAWRAFRGRLGEFEGLSYDAIVALAALLWFWRPSARAFTWLAPVGLMSYAIYIFQRPVQWLVLDYLPLPMGTTGSFVLRLLVTASLTLLVSYLAERVLQPRIRKWCNRGTSKSSPVEPLTAKEPLRAAL